MKEAHSDDLQSAKCKYWGKKIRPALAISSPLIVAVQGPFNGSIQGMGGLLMAPSKGFV